MSENEEKKGSDMREKIKSYIDIGVAASQKGLKSAGKAITDFGDKSVQRIELTKLRTKEGKAFAELGKAVYKKLSSKAASVEASDEELSDMLKAIDKLEKDIKKLGGTSKTGAEKAAKTSRAKAEEPEKAEKPAAKKTSAKKAPAKKTSKAGTGAAKKKSPARKPKAEPPAE